MAKNLTDVWSLIITPSATTPQQDAIHFIVAFVLAVSLMAADRYGNMVSDVRSVFLTVLTPVEQLATLPQELFNSVEQDFSEIDELKRQNEILKTEVLLLKAKQQQVVNLKQEVHRLEALLGTTGQIDDYTMQIASVSFYSDNPISQYLTVNKGSNEDIANGQAVIDASGIVGQVVTTSPFSAQIMLITDPEHHIPVRIQRTSQRGILSGTGHDHANLNYIPKSSTVKVGDILESSGMGGLYPAGYPVATVVSVNKKDSGPYYQIQAIPFAEFNKAHKVLILKPKPEPTNIETNLEYTVNPEELDDLNTLPAPGAGEESGASTTTTDKNMKRQENNLGR